MFLASFQNKNVKAYPDKVKPTNKRNIDLIETKLFSMKRKTKTIT